VVGLQRFVLAEALRLGASDIHIDPGGRASRVRYRIDGHMTDAFQIPKWLHHRLVARIKVMARLDISEQRRPQDGHLDDPAHGVEARLSTLPTWRGEAVVLRLFGDRGELPSLGRIGCGPGIRDQLLAIGHQPQGVLLVTGPTGSGKTTTLYAVLNDLRHQPLNIVTIEDPVEYRVDGVRQVQVDERTGLSFESALRSTLRQDPDVILVGEIRDAETARIAFHAGLTGHLVLSTLHATEAVAVLSRLSELGVSRGVVASTLVGVVAQRLVRRNCRLCSEPDPAPSWLLTRMRVSREEAGGLKRSRGCLACGWEGASGRLAVFEVLEPDREFRRAVLGGRDEDLRAAAANAGLIPLSRQTRDLVLSGEIAIREAYRTCHFGALG
jgi:type II secretory ATPase GspE/PulE/Tfp pilus assembly ATPase PilB-like protein